MKVVFVIGGCKRWGDGGRDAQAPPPEGEAHHHGVPLASHKKGFGICLSHSEIGGMGGQTLEGPFSAVSTPMQSVLFAKAFQPCERRQYDEAPRQMRNIILKLVLPRKKRARRAAETDSSKDIIIFVEERRRTNVALPRFSFVNWLKARRIHGKSEAQPREEARGSISK